MGVWANRGLGLLALIGAIGLAPVALAQASDTIGVVVDQASGEVKMVVVPSDVAELNDPAFNPPGSVQVRLPKGQFQGTTPEQFVARASAAAQMQVKARRPVRPAPTRAAPSMTATETAEFERMKSGGVKK